MKNKDKSQDPSKSPLNGETLYPSLFSPFKGELERVFYLSLLFCLLFVTGIHATVAEKTYTEADDGVKPDKEVWGKLEQRLYASWASRDVHYVKRAVPQLRVKTDTIVYAFSIRVPKTATPGLSRLRTCFADAWRDAPGPCGELPIGFAMDIPMQIAEDETPVEAVKPDGSRLQFKFTPKH